MGNGDVAGLVRMLVLPVVALATNALPTLGLEPPDDIDATHVVYAYTTCSGGSKRLDEWPDGVGAEIQKVHLAHLRELAKTGKRFCDLLKERSSERQVAAEPSVGPYGQILRSSTRPPRVR
jgi:hypothetical protein